MSIPSRLLRTVSTVLYAKRRNQKEICLMIQKGIGSNTESPYVDYLKGTLTNNDWTHCRDPFTTSSESWFLSYTIWICLGTLSGKISRWWEDPSYRVSQKSDTPHPSAAFDGVNMFYKAVAHHYNVKLSIFYHFAQFSS